MSGIAITGLAVHTLRLPVRSRRRQGSGDATPEAEVVVVRIDTDAGIHGWGEAAPWAVFTGTVEAAAAALHVHFRPILEGADPFDVQRLLARADRAVVGAPEAKAAMEMALFDIMGRALGTPVHNLLGGAVRTEIPLSFSIANPDIDADVETAAALYGEGHRIFKVKTGFAGHAEDIRRLEKLRIGLPDDVDLRVDYNQGLEPSTPSPGCATSSLSASPSSSSRCPPSRHRPWPGSPVPWTRPSWPTRRCSPRTRR